jgi:hypothetical protein
MEGTLQPGGFAPSEGNDKFGDDGDRGRDKEMKNDPFSLTMMYGGNCCREKHWLAHILQIVGHGALAAKFDSLANRELVRLNGGWLPMHVDRVGVDVNSQESSREDDGEHSK